MNITANKDASRRTKDRLKRGPFISISPPMQTRFWGGPAVLVRSDIWFGWLPCDEIVLSNLGPCGENV